MKWLFSIFLFIGSFVCNGQEQNMLYRKVWGPMDNMFTSRIQFADQCSNGDYILIGLTTENSWGELWFYFARTDSAGNILMESKWGNGNNENRIAKVIETTDGDYLVCGSAAPGAGSFALFRVDQNGTLLFSQYYDFYLGDLAFGITPTMDSCYIICGLRASLSSTACPAFVKVDRDGNEIWRRTQSTYVNYCPLFVAVTPDSGFIVAGVRDNNDNSYYAKYDKDGYMIWMQYQFGMTDSFPDQPEYVRCNTDGTFDIYYSIQMLSGNPPSPVRGLLIHYDIAGDTGWTKSFLDPINHIFDSDGTKLRAIDFHMEYITIDTSGEVNKLIDEAIGSTDYCIVTRDSGFLTVGSSDTYQSNYWNLQFQISKYGKDGRYEPLPFLANIILHPNPSLDGNTTLSFDTQTDENVQVRVLAMDGRLVYYDEIFCPANSHTELPIHLDAATTTAGMYILEVKTDGEYRRERIIVARNTE